MITGVVDKTAADPLIGTTIAQYEVVARLGGGGMGIVYTARDTRLGRRVALKFLPPRWSHDDSAKQRFIREAQAASATDHRNICTIHDIETAADGQLFIVMAHYDGQTLKQRLEAGGLSVEDAVEIAAQVAEGLAKAHGQGVVHRDIKPGNLILTEDGVKILDFGLAKLAAEALRLTLEGTTIGTVAYMSPEQARGDDADPRSDIWALGVVLYEMLAGQPPFRGHYAEAISHAIRHETPAPLRTLNPDVPDALERLVVRALDKDPNARIQTARELARDLRLLQGRTLPLDLRTEPLASIPQPARLRSARGGADTGAGFWNARKAIVSAAVVIAAVAGAALWVFSPIERIPVAIVPVVNQTGYAELDAYRLALTQTLADELRGSRHMRVVPYDRVRQIVRRFQGAGGDVSSREAIQALAAQSGARLMVVPALVYENGAWKARAEFRNAETATSEAMHETAPVVSSLPKDAAYSLVTSLAAGIDERVGQTAPARARLADALRRIVGRASPAPRPALQTLDAAAAFEQGIDAYEQQEHSAALRFFTTAAQLDARNPIPQAWRSRTAWLMRQDREAQEAADQAVRLAAVAELFPTDAIFVQAVSAEVRRDARTAGARYQDLVAAQPDEPAWITELAGFQDRQLQTTAAVESYHRALALDPRLIRPHLELCRLYGASRLNDPPNAKQQGRLALAAYRAAGARAGEGQALWCLTDTLRVGNPDDRLEARRNADAALAIFQGSGFEYNRSRAEYYVALAALAQGKQQEAAEGWERSLMTARRAGNALLEPLVLMNLGVMYEALGDRARAAASYEQSRARYEALGDEARAAQTQANQAALLIEYGPDPAQGLRNMQNALAVVQKLGDKNFEAFCLQLIGAHYRYAGRHADAEQALNRALAILKERNLDDDVAYVTIDLARTYFDVSDYARARDLLVQAAGDGTGPRATEARLRLGLTHVRLGDLDTAAAELAAAANEVRQRGQRGLVPQLHASLGELAYQTGDLRAARAEFEQASALWTDALPDAASVEARAYLGHLDTLGPARERGRATLLACLQHAEMMGRAGLEARVRLFLARADVAARRFDAALATLAGVPADDGSTTLGRELRAQLHHWRAAALAGRGDRAGADAEAAQARKLLRELQAALPERDRARFTARPDIRDVI
jgi:tetratricopeptide (TPR) repeat protein